MNPIPTCPNCEPDEAMPAAHELLKEIPEDDEGEQKEAQNSDYSVYTEI